MTINKKLMVTAALLSAIGFMAMTPPADPKDEGFKNLKVLPKKISHERLHKVMDQWSFSLGVRCNFCHTRDEANNKMDWASDAKPEKEMARHMFKMTAAINKKYFEAKKDSTGMIADNGVNCYSCHRGTQHPELTFAPERRGPGGPPPVSPPPAGGSAPAGAPGTPPPGGRE